jgi:hypothetical protein
MTEVWMIGKVERLNPELRLERISDSKSTEETEIEISGTSPLGSEARVRTR